MSTQNLAKFFRGDLQAPIGCPIFTDWPNSHCSFFLDTAKICIYKLFKAYLSTL